MTSEEIKRMDYWFDELSLEKEHRSKILRIKLLKALEKQMVDLGIKHILTLDFRL